MTQNDLSLFILHYLDQSGKAIRFSKISKDTWQLYGKENFKNEETFSVYVARELKTLEKEELIQREAFGHKNVCYSIKDHLRVQLILVAHSAGIQILSKPTSFKLKLPTATIETYEQLVAYLSKYLLNLIFSERPSPPQPFTPWILGFREIGDIFRDKILFIGPDPASADKMRKFTEEDYDDLTMFLAKAWGTYMSEPSRCTHNDIIMIKFTERQLKKLRESGENLDKIVYEAALKTAGKVFLLPRIEDLPATREAIEKGIFLNQEEAYKNYILKGEKTMAKRLLEGIK